jgi:Icc-related predicted phosphoesterase
MKILVITDIHGYYEKAFSNLSKINTSKFHIMVCPGDFTDMFNQPPGFSQMDVADLLLQKLLSFNLPLYCVPGNHDPHEIIELLDEYGVNLHNRVRVFKGMKFMGFGGAATPFNTIFEPSDEEIKENLERMGGDVKNKNFVLVVHNPPRNTKVDMVAGGEHVGSQAIREFIMKRQPLLVVSAHIHESSGIDKIGETTLFYPGPLYDGYYGVVDIKGKEVKCEIKKI